MQKFIFIGLLITFGVFAQAQNDSIPKFSLEEAKKYGLEHHANSKNAQLDIIAAKKKVIETTAIGLPQVNAEGAFTYDVELSPFMEQIAPFSLQDNEEFNNPNTSDARRQQLIDEQIDNMRSSSTLDVTVSQLIFSGSYIVGLQTSKIYKQLSEYSAEATADEVVKNIVDAYYTVKIAEKNLTILDSSVIQLESLLNDMRAMAAQGFIEQIDADQIEINLVTVKNARSLIARQLALSIQLFNFHVGLDINRIPVLTSELEELQNLALSVDASIKPYNVEEDPTVKILNTQEQLMTQNVRLQKSAYLPSLAGYYVYHKNFNEDAEASDFMPSQRVGLTLQVPIFSSGDRLMKVQQAQIELDKTKNSNHLAKQGLMLEFEQARTNYLTAKDNLEANDKSLSLAKRVYDHNIIKFKNGMASSADLTQAQSQYLQHQSQYFSTLLELVTAKSELDKKLNNY